jgi:hypothetical protein
LGRSPTMASHADRMTSGEFSMEEMLASVRSILEADEQKENGLVRDTEPQLDSSPRRGRMQRPEPQPRSAAGSFQARPPSQRASSPPLQVHQRTAAPHGAEINSLRDLSQSVLRTPAREGDLQAWRGSEVQDLSHLLQHIPRKARIGTPQTIQVRLSREEAASIFGSPPRSSRSPHPVCRAVSLRLSAPEGGFLVEALTPETQWIFDRPSFLGEEAFGTWAWTAVPSESGAYNLMLSAFARDIDPNGLAGDLSIPEQVIRIRVRGSFWRAVAGFLRTIMILLLGSGLAVGAYYALKMAGKLPH